MIRAIVFDYAGVLVDSPLKNWMKEHMPDDEKREHAFREITTKGDRGEVNVQEFFSLIEKYTNLQRDTIFQTIYQRARINKTLFALIEKLKRTYTIALFSNNQNEIVCAVLEYNNALKLFDEIIISSKHHMVKPEEQFYKKLLDILQLPAHDVVFIDDRIENITKAKSLGIQAFLFTDNKKLQHDLRAVGVLW